MPSAGPMMPTSLTEKNGSLHLTDTLSQKGLSRMLEDFLALTQD